MDTKTYLIQLIDATKTQPIFSKKISVEKNIYLEHGRLTQAVQNIIPIEYTTLIYNDRDKEKYTLHISREMNDGSSDEPIIVKGLQITRNDFGGYYFYE